MSTNRSVATSRNSVRTGTFCSYSPEHPTIWDLR